VHLAGALKHTHLHQEVDFAKTAFTQVPPRKKEFSIKYLGSDAFSSFFQFEEEEYMMIPTRF
jgi:hypothetical protein